MHFFQSTKSWKKTLGKKTKVLQPQIDILSSAFISFRSKAEEIVALLPQNLKELTIHDMRHIDALWQTCDIIGGDDLLSNPLEGFVLGGAFLLHDLGLALASYPGGIKELFEAPFASSNLTDSQIDQRLRLEHAKHAKSLALTSYGGKHLIENETLREGLGPLIGLIAFSHWQSTDELDASPELSNQRGAPPTGEFPADWQVDGKKLAYLLRTCDACQIDGRRAPSLAMTLRKPKGISLLHWFAQNPVQQPYSKDGKLVFTASRPFSIDHREAWWTFYDLAQIADRELRNGEEYFSSNGLSLSVNRIAGIASPKQFGKYVHTQDWIPIDTTPRVSDTQGLIERLGGTALYGTDYKVPLRELIQNARDAVACRRALEKRDRSWGEIRVSISDSDRGKTLMVSDDGKGISEKGFEYLLDFGGQYWKSSLSREENEGIDQSSFEPAGVFGIGFFSVFMLSKRVKVTTRRCDDGKSNTRVLEFTNGLSERPILRLARPEEVKFEAGTDVLVEIDGKIEAEILRPIQDSADKLSFNTPVSIRDSWSLRDLLEWMSPTLDTNLLVVHPDGRREIAIIAGDWRTLTNNELAFRLMSHRKNPKDCIENETLRNVVDRFMPVLSSNQVATARIAVHNPLHDYLIRSGLPFVNTCGGFRAGWSFFPGVTLSVPTTANRIQSTECYQKDHASIKRWASAQSECISKNLDLKARQKTGLAFWIRVCDGDLKDLPIAYHFGRLISALEFANLIQDRDEVLISDELMYVQNEEVMVSTYTWLTLNPTEESPSKRREMLEAKDVFYITTGRLNLGRPLGEIADPQCRASHPQWKRYWYSLWGAAFEAVANAWGCSIDALLSNSNIVPKEEFGMRQEDILRRPKQSSS